MSPDLSTSVKWGLRIGGIAGVLLSLATVPTVWGTVTGHANLAYYNEYVSRVPLWAQWRTISGAGVGLVVVGAIAALLIVAGRWPSRLLAVPLPQSSSTPKQPSRERAIG